MTKPDYADEMGARLSAIGLTDEKRIAANENAPTRLDLYASRGHRVPSTDPMRSPGELTRQQLIEHAEIDGWCDAKLDRPMTIAHRFCEANLHLENMGAFALYAEAYERAYRGAK